MLNTQSLKITNPTKYSRSFPIGGYEKRLQARTQQLKEEVYGIQTIQPKEGIRPAQNVESDRAGIPITRIREEFRSPLARNRAREPLPTAWREGFELALWTAFAILVTFVCMGWVM